MAVQDLTAVLESVVAGKWVLGFFPAIELEVSAQNPEQARFRKESIFGSGIAERIPPLEKQAEAWTDAKLVEMMDASPYFTPQRSRKLLRVYLDRNPTLEHLKSHVVKLLQQKDTGKARQRIGIVADLLAGKNMAKASLSGR